LCQRASEAPLAFLVKCQIIIYMELFLTIT
jgi:hypothetical protein